MWMDNWKRILWKLLFPKTISIVLLFLVSALLLFYAFLEENCPEWAAYISYTISAYTLIIIYARIPEMVKKIKKQLYSNPYTSKYLTEKELRIRLSLYSGLMINFCFAIFKILMGVVYQSRWLFAIAGYHMILSGMRFVLVYKDQTGKKATECEKRLHELHGYQVCGWLMLLLNIAISVIVFMVVLENQTIVYPGYMIYAIGAYTFYCLTMAMIHMVKYRHRNNPIFSAVKRMELAKALVSIFTLQAAMLTQFGQNNTLDNKIANGATGFGVCIIITVMAVLMLIGVGKDNESINKEMG